MSGNELAEVEVDYLRHTAAAVLVRDANDREIWLPFSTVEYDGDMGDLTSGDAITLQVQEWIAKKNDLI